MFRRVSSRPGSMSRCAQQASISVRASETLKAFGAATEKPWAELLLKTNRPWRQRATGFTRPCWMPACRSLRPPGPVPMNQRHTCRLSIESFKIFSPPVFPLWSHAVLRPAGAGAVEVLRADLRVFDDLGQVVAAAQGMAAKRSDAEALRTAAHKEPEDLIYEVKWLPPAGGFHAETARPAGLSASPVQITGRLRPKAWGPGSPKSPGNVSGTFPERWTASVLHTLFGPFGNLAGNLRRGRLFVRCDG